MNRRLYRCRHDKRIAGVASGLAEYFDLDPTVVRIVWVLSIFFGGLSLLLYVAMAIIVPLEPEDGLAPATGQTGDPTDQGAVPAPTGWQAAPASHRHVIRDHGRTATFFGVILILFGSLALLDRLLPAWADGGHFLWPAFIVGIGVLLVATAMRRESTGS